jgi:hypothetical protein
VRWHRRLLIFVVAISILAPTAHIKAQQATPESRSVLDGLVGVEAGANRTFNSVSTSLDGTKRLLFAVAQFDNPEHAHDAVSIILDRYLKQLKTEIGVTGLVPTSVRAIGDETFARTGESTFFGGDSGDTATFAVLFVRNGPLVYLGVGIALLGGPLGDVADALVAVLERSIGGDATPVGAHDYHYFGSLAIITPLAALLYGLPVTYLAVFSHTSLKRTAIIAGMTGVPVALMIIIFNQWLIML